MANTEKRDLEKVYSNMLNGELELLAAQAFELTDAAKPVLSAEIAKRGLGYELRAAPEATERRPEALQPGEALARIGRVWDLREAKHVQEILDRVHVPLFFGPENLQELDGNASYFEAGTFPEGIDLKVKEVHVEIAATALSMATPLESDAVPEVDFATECPQCRSGDVILEGVDQNDGQSESKFNWVCGACGHDWTDEGLGT